VKIERVEAIRLNVPLDRSWQCAAFTMTERTVVLVRVHTDSEIVGLGDAFHLHLPDPTVVANIVESVLNPLLIGENPLAIQRLWHKMHSGIMHLGSAGIGAIAGVDIALWDILGKFHDAPIYRLLGGEDGTTIRPYVGSQTLGWRDLDSLDELVDEALDYVRRGYQALKVRGGRGLPERREDLESIRRVREAVGDDVKLLVDVNGGYSMTTARVMARVLSEYNLFWLEDPIEQGADEAPEKYAELARVSEVPIAVGGNLFGRNPLRKLISAGGVDIVKPDSSTAGGITELLKMVHMTSAWGMKWAPVTHEPVGMLATLHALAAAPPETVNGMFVEWDPDWPLGDFLTKPPRFEDGVIVLPDGPGLGTDIKESFLERYQVRNDLGMVV
jgi:L-alanine-DL-glutamate epimerase-like enolase superfamily enzyme